MNREPDERRAMVRAARIATDRAKPSAPESQPRSPSTLWEQTVQVATGWIYLAPFLLASPFLWNPPLWIAALNQLPEREPPADPKR
jgi:hypothetical protein